MRVRLALAHLLRKAAARLDPEPIMRLPDLTEAQRDELVRTFERAGRGGELRPLDSVEEITLFPAAEELRPPTPLTRGKLRP